MRAQLSARGPEPEFTQYVASTPGNRTVLVPPSFKPVFLPVLWLAGSKSFLIKNLGADRSRRTSLRRTNGRPLTFARGSQYGNHGRIRPGANDCALAVDFVYVVEQRLSSCRWDRDLAARRTGDCGAGSQTAR